MVMAGVEWVNPFAVPLKRRLQTTVVLFYMSTFVIFPLASIMLLTVLFFTPFFPLVGLYLTWLFFDTVIRKTPCRGGRTWPWLRSHWMWTYMRDYFPAVLVKSTDLDPSKNYVFGYHPHGVLSYGAICSFGTDSTGFSKAFPGIQPHPLTLKDNFRLPLIRDFALWLGICSVSKDSIEWLLTKKGPGHSPVIVIGGAEEALEARPGEYRLTLKNRKGFVKIAIRCGASLVPVYSFGESELYQQADNPEGSFIRKVQEKFKRLFGFTAPLFYGRGIFNYTFGLMPYRKPIVTVVGKPIALPLDETPKQEVIDKYHDQYMKELEELFNKYKTRYGIPEDKILHFV